MSVDRVELAVRELVAALRAELAPADPTPRLYSVNEAAGLLGLSRARTYQLIAAGELRSRRVGGRRLVPSGAVRDFVEADNDEATAAGVLRRGGPIKEVTDAAGQPPT